MSPTCTSLSPRTKRLSEDDLDGWDYDTWWVPLLDTHAQMVMDAGYSDVRSLKVV